MSTLKKSLIPSGGFMTPEQFYQSQRLNKLRDQRNRQLSKRFDLSVYDIRDRVREEQLEVLGDRRLTKRTSDGGIITGGDDVGGDDSTSVTISEEASQSGVPKDDPVDDDNHQEESSAPTEDDESNDPDDEPQDQDDDACSTDESEDASTSDATTEDGDNDDGHVTSDTNNQDDAGEPTSNEDDEQGEPASDADVSEHVDNDQDEEPASDDDASSKTSIVKSLVSKGSGAISNLTKRLSQSSQSDDKLSNVMLPQGETMAFDQSNNRVSRRSIFNKVKGSRVSHRSSNSSMSSRISSKLKKKSNRVSKADKFVTDMFNSDNPEGLNAEEYENKINKLAGLVKRKGAKQSLKISEDNANILLSKVLIESVIQDPVKLPALVKGLAAMIYVEYDSALVSTATVLRKIVSVKNQPHNAAVIGTGIVPRLIELAEDRENVDLRFEICWTLTNLARGSHSDTAAVVDGGALPVIVSLLKKSPMNIRHQAAWCIGNIAADCVEFRKLALEADALVAIELFIKEAGGYRKQTETSLPKVRTGAWALYNLTRCKSTIEWDLVKAAAKPATRLLKFEDEDVVVNGCWALANITDKDEKHVQECIDKKALAQLIALLGRKEHSILTPVIKTLGYFVLAGDETNQLAIDSKILKAIKVLLESVNMAGGSAKDDEGDTGKLALWLLANIASGSAQQIKVVFDSGIIEDIVNYWSPSSSEIAFEERDINLLSEAAWVLCNATRRASQEEIQKLVDYNYLGVVKWGLQPEQQRGLKIHTLKGLWCVLAMGSQNRRCTCNEYFSAVSDAGLETLVRDILNSELEKRVRQWCKAIVFMMDGSRCAFDKLTGEPIAHWSTDMHHFYPTDFKDGVEQIVLAHHVLAKDNPTVGFGSLSDQSVLKIISFCGSSFFCDPQLLMHDT